MQGEMCRKSHRARKAPWTYRVVQHCACFRAIWSRARVSRLCLDDYRRGWRTGVRQPQDHFSFGEPTINGFNFFRAAVSLASSARYSDEPIPNNSSAFIRALRASLYSRCVFSRSPMVILASLSLNYPMELNVWSLFIFDFVLILNRTIGRIFIYDYLSQ